MARKIRLMVVMIVKKRTYLNLSVEIRINNYILIESSEEEEENNDGGMNQ